MIALEIVMVWLFVAIPIAIAAFLAGLRFADPKANAAKERDEAERTIQILTASRIVTYSQETAARKLAKESRSNHEHKPVQ